MHNSGICRILSSLHGVDKVLRDCDLVESGRRANHSDTGHDLRLNRLHPNSLQACVIMLKSGDRFCNDLWFGIQSFQASLVLLHQEKDPKVSINNTTSVWACVSPPHIKSSMSFRWRMKRLATSYPSKARRWAAKSSTADSSPGGIDMASSR